MFTPRAPIATLAAVASLLLTVAWQPHSFGSRAELCFTEPATITGATHFPNIQGTKGPDVVITNGSQVIETLGGDDLVCVTGKAEAVFIDLGEGADQLTGSSGPEEVYAGHESASGDDRDIIDTGAGKDTVYSGASGPGRDDIDLGPGADGLVMNGPLREANLVGGPGRDRLVLLVRARFGVPLRFDNRSEEARLRDAVVLRWSSFSAFQFDVAQRGPLTFVGSGQSERLSVSRVYRRWGADIRMLGGRDHVWTSRVNSHVHGGKGADVLEAGLEPSTLLGGPGNDLLRGSSDDDELIGGPGRDDGRGRAGIDRCATELRTECERR